MNEEKISIIVPVYNVEAYLERCVESILKQTYTNLEILLVNDGSTDKSGELCDKLALRDHRIRVIHKENGGLSDARNRGIDEASSNLIGLHIGTPREAIFCIILNSNFLEFNFSLLQTRKKYF